MNINFENTPTVIFDWIEKFSFSELDDSQKRLVLNHFSEEEYEEMRHTALNLKSVSQSKQKIESKYSKAILLNHFDRHHALNIPGNFFSKGTIVWQAAAMILMVLSGWLFYQVFDLKRDLENKEVATADTVYVEKEIKSEPQIIHDTIFRYKEVVKDHEVNEHSGPSVIEMEDIGSTGELEPLQPSELENISGAPRGNSMKDDSLIRKFGFVTM